MVTEVTEPLKYAYGVLKQLSTTYAEALGAKHIFTQSALLKLMKIDFDKTIHALIEVRHHSVSKMLHEFFGDQPTVIASLMPWCSSDRLAHIGFEVYEPLDIVLYGFEHWIEKSAHLLDLDIRIEHYLRFPASQQFQQRVGATTEIMRLVLRVEQHDLMLELFDIHRPPQAPTVTTNTRDIAALAAHTTYHRDVIRQLFATDTIWHYAIEVQSPDTVVAVHHLLTDLAASHHNYQLAYSAPVTNTSDGSFHTKIGNRSHATELEFVAKYRE